MEVVRKVVVQELPQLMESSGVTDEAVAMCMEAVQESVGKRLDKLERRSSSSRSMDRSKEDELERLKEVQRENTNSLSLSLRLSLSLSLSLRLSLRVTWIHIMWSHVMRSCVSLRVTWIQALEMKNKATDLRVEKLERQVGKGGVATRTRIYWHGL